jgi:chloramphenicol-sensitive protein RarD
MPDALNIPADSSAPAPRVDPALAREAEAARQNTRIGVGYGLGAYLWWGLVPLYFKAVAHVPALEVLAHRVVWSVLLLVFLMQRRGKLSTAWALRRDHRVLLTLFGTTALIAVNWFTFIWAIANQRTLEAGLGYFINPLVNVMLGFVFLGERLRPWQAVSVALAAIGVGYRTYEIGTLPGVALILAFSFGLYGLFRKTARVEALVGLTVETTLLLPLALVYLVFLGAAERMYFVAYSWPTTILLAMGGVITSVPLLWFTNAARRLRLATLGFLQYIAPSMQCLIAVVVFGEPFARTQWVTFGLIWTALAIYSIDAYRAMARVRALGGR